ncbi:hypothetical protein, partial [Salmonella sp. hn-h4]|uniref:hypothetical protein n=1 Tax=Salmonella sp. hn-h4 TaxID=2582612 RepID=UPI001F18FBAE
YQKTFGDSIGVATKSLNPTEFFLWRGPCRSCVFRATGYLTLCFPENRKRRAGPGMATLCNIGTQARLLERDDRQLLRKNQGK